jgi:hypothetical protein
MKEENLEGLFKQLQGSFDTEEPSSGHKARFLERLTSARGVVSLKPKKIHWWKPLSIAASIAVLCAVGIGLLNNPPTLEERVAKISPEVSQSQLYFTSLIEEQVKQLESESTPKTKQMIDDTMLQLKKLETDYRALEQDLLKGRNSKLILSAMITNYQTRIDLLQEVTDKIENINESNTYNDENLTI